MGIEFTDKKSSSIKFEDDVISSDGLLGKSKVDEFLNVPMQERVLSGSIGGLIPAVGGATNSEDVLPALMGGIGGTLGSFIGHPNVGVGIGTAVGDLEKQTVKKLTGDGEDINVEDAIILGGAASLGSAALEGLFKTVGIGINMIPERARARLFDKALQAVNIGRKQLSRNWESSVNELVKNNPETRVNLKPVMEKLKGQFDKVDDTLIPQLKTAVDRNPILKRAVEDPSQAIALTLKEAQELKNAVSSSVKSITKKALKGETLPTEKVVFEVLDQFDDSITKYFPEMLKVKQLYRKGMEQFRLARPLVEPGKSVESSVFSNPQGVFGLGGSPFMGSTQGRLAFKDLLENIPGGTGNKLFAALKASHNINRISDAIGRLGQIAVGGAVAGKSIRKVNEVIGE